MANTPGPGPWTVERTSEDVIAVRDATGQLQLIATRAVPDLLDSLRTARRVLTVACGTEGPYIRIALANIDAAIAKAEGN